MSYRQTPFRTHRAPPSPALSIVSPSDMLSSAPPSANPAPHSRSRSRTNTGTSTGSRSNRRTRTRARTRTRTISSGAVDEVVVAIIENNAKDVGMSSYDINSFDVEMRQFADGNSFTQTICFLIVLSPVEILLSSDSEFGSLEQAIRACKDIQDVKISYVFKRFFNDTQGAIDIQKYSVEQCPNLRTLGESACYLALASCAALLHHVQTVETITFMPSTLRIRLLLNEHTLFLDAATLYALEILTNAHATTTGFSTARSKLSLLSVIDRTSTRAGKRFLRRALLEPSSYLPLIRSRQDAVEDLSNSQRTFNAIRTVLGNFPDLEYSVSVLMSQEHERLKKMAERMTKNNETTMDDRDTSSDMESAGHSRREYEAEDIAMDTDEETGEDEGREDVDGEAIPWDSSRRSTKNAPSMALIHNVLNIKMALHAVNPLLQALQGTKCDMLTSLSGALRLGEYSNMEVKIGDVIQEESVPNKGLEQLRLSTAYAVKVGRNDELDFKRKLLEERLKDMQMIVQDIHDKHGMQKAKLAFQVKRGYHIVMPTNSMRRRDFPESFVNVHMGNRLCRFSTDNLEIINATIEELLREVWYLTELELGGLLNEVTYPCNLSALHLLSDNVAALDCMMSFVMYASHCPVPTVRPTFRKGGTLAFKQAHHPILVGLNADMSVPNDVFLDDSARMHIITGGNMSGKSTFLRMVATNTILAHAGCNVPAKCAHMRVFNVIATKLVNGSDVMQNESHFSREMRDIGTICDVTGAGLGDRRFVYGNSTSTVQGKPHEAGKDEDNEKEKGQTLVVIDEVGRSTDVENGFAFAYAIAEALANTTNVLSLFVTHFHGVAALTRVNPTVQSFHLQTVAEQQAINNAGVATTDAQHDGGTTVAADAVADCNSRITFTYKIQDGELQESGYGLRTARLSGRTEECIREVFELARKLKVNNIATVDGVVGELLRPLPKEWEYIRKAQRVVGVAQQLAYIEVTAGSPEAAEERRVQLREKVTTRSDGGDTTRAAVAMSGNGEAARAEGSAGATASTGERKDSDRGSGTDK